LCDAGRKGECELVGFGGHVGLVGFGLVFFMFFFFFSKINLHLKQNIKFRLYKIKITHANKLFLWNAMK
jgi:hypothetical protein